MSVSSSLFTCIFIGYFLRTLRIRYVFPIGLLDIYRCYELYQSFLFFAKFCFASWSKYSSLPACMQAGKLLYGYLKRYFIFQRRLLCLCSQQFHDCSLEIVVQVHSLKLGNLLQNRGVLAYHFIDCCFQIKLDLCTFQNFKNMALGLISVQAGLLRQADLISSLRDGRSS